MTAPRLQGTPARGAAISQQLAPGFRVSEQVVAAKALQSIPRPAGGLPLRVRGASFVVLTLRLDNLGPAAIRAIDAAGGFLVRDSRGRLWALAPACRGISVVYAKETGSRPSPNTVLGPGSVVTTVAVYAIAHQAAVALENRDGQYITLPGG
jgi:hypothetical protein